MARWCQTHSCTLWALGWVLGVISLLSGCSGNVNDSNEHVAPPDGGRTILPLETDPVSLPAGEEILLQCQRFPLDNDDWLFVDEVKLDATLGVHHSDWFVAPEDSYAGPATSSACEDFGFGLVESGDPTKGTILFSQSTQVRTEVFSFGEGAAFPVPPRSQIFVSYHLFNTQSEALDISIAADLSLAPEEDVDVRLNIGGGLLGVLSVPPRVRSHFSADCFFSEPAAFRAYYVMPHYHRLGTGFQLQVLGGPSHLATIWTSARQAGEPLGGRLDPPFDLSGAEGIRFRCTYDNPTDMTFSAGASGEKEMCSFFVHTDADRSFYGLIVEGFGPVRLEELEPDENGERTFNVDGCVMLESDGLGL